MSLQSRREYLLEMRKRYAASRSRRLKSQIIDEVMRTLGYHRKYAIVCLNGPPPTPKPRTRRRRARRYQAAWPVIEMVWEALDYACAERLHPVLTEVAEQLAAHGELVLTPAIREELGRISRATLARRLADRRTPKARRFAGRKVPGRLRAEVPIGRYDWQEARPGALEIDLVEHNGGQSLGHFAYTLTVVDVVTGFSRRRAILGRSQAAVLAALQPILADWPHAPWALHIDNGSEFLNRHLVGLAQQHGWQLTRSRPYRKNDSPHVEQRNRQFVREVVGYERYDTPGDVAWLNAVYAIVDVYANLFLPTRKVIAKTRRGGKVSKAYDQARTPWQRLLDTGVVSTARQVELQALRNSLNPLQLHRQLEKLLAEGAITQLRSYRTGSGSLTTRSHRRVVGLPAITRLRSDGQLPGTCPHRGRIDRPLRPLLGSRMRRARR